MRPLQYQNMALITQQLLTTWQYATIGLYDVTVKSCSPLCCPRNNHATFKSPVAGRNFPLLPVYCCVCNSTTSGLW